MPFRAPPRVTVCPECGAEQKALTDVVERPGELVNFGIKNLSQQLHLMMQQTNKQLVERHLGYAVAKGKSSGWASHTYKAKLAYARSLADFPVIRRQGLGFIRHRAIAWAKEKEIYKLG